MDALLHRAAHLLALVFFAALVLITYLLALVIFNGLDLLRLHQAQLQPLWVVELVTRDKSLVFPAYTGLLNHDVAALALVVVAFLLALMSPTGKELLTDACLTDWNRICAFPTLFSQELKYFFAAARAEFDSDGHLLAGLASTFVTSLCARMLSTVQHLVANVVANELLAPALDRFLLFPTVASHLDVNVALLANPLVACVRAFVVLAI